MKMTKSQIIAAEKWYNRTIERGFENPNNKSTGHLYAHKLAAQIVLPKELSSFKNAASGNTNSIRITTSDSVKYVKNVFKTFASFKNFVESSDCNGDARRRVNRDVAKMVENTLADKVWGDYVYSKFDVPMLAKKFGRDNVLAARKYLTVGEMKLRFGL